MAIKYFCDRCGKEVAAEGDLRAVKIEDSGAYRGFDEYQVCPTCRAEIHSRCQPLAFPKQTERSK